MKMVLLRMMMMMMYQKMNLAVMKEEKEPMGIYGWCEQIYMMI